MRYFNSLPEIIVKDGNNNNVVMKNLLVRTQLIPQLAKNPLIYYKYSVQDGDTPEIIADKYYGDSYRYWMVLYGNSNILDPQWDWPLSTQQFLKYLKDKYSDAAGGPNLVLSYTKATIHHYEKVIETTDNTTNTKAIKTVEVDYDSYTTIQTFTETKTFADGSSVTYKEYGQQVSIYDYEVKLNESKRDINLINSKYTMQLESQYNSLVKS